MGAECLLNTPVPHSGVPEPRGRESRGAQLDRVLQGEGEGAFELKSEERLRRRKSEGPFQAKATACPDTGGVIDREGTINVRWVQPGPTGQRVSRALPSRGDFPGGQKDMLPLRALNRNGMIRFRCQEDGSGSRLAGKGLTGAPGGTEASEKT